MEQVTRREWLWAAIVSGLIVLASTAPYVAGYLAQTSDVRFTGALLDRADYHSHLAKMWQGYQGQWRYRLLFTPENHNGVFVQTFYVALGHVARLFGLSLPLTYQISRVLLGASMLLMIYRFIACFAAVVRTRRVAFLLATVSSGIGWLTEALAPTPAGGVSPMEFWLLDGFTYLALLTSPHFCTAIFLILNTFLLLLPCPQEPSLAKGAVAVVGSLALGIIHPYAMLLADLLPVLYWAARWLRTRELAWRGVIAVAAMGMSQIPLLIYDLWVFRTQSVFAGWSAQNVTLSPPPRIYLLGYGMLLTLAALGAMIWARRGGRKLAFPLLWIGLVVVLVYLPWNLQRRFLEGVQVPLGLLAGVGLTWMADHVTRTKRTQWLVRSTAIALAVMSNLYLTTGLTLAAATRAPALFWSADLLAGVEWLGENTSWEETVLAGPETGNLIPARIGHRVVIGHGMETISYEDKQEAVTRFFSSDASNADRLALVKKWEVKWVFHGPEERGLGSFDPGSVPWLLPVFRSRRIAIYRVSLESEP